MKFDLLRRATIVRDAADEAWQRDGFRGVWKFYGAFQGIAADPELAWRYKRLGLLPEGTLGREYWAHMTVRRFAFPGDTEDLYDPKWDFWPLMSLPIDEVRARYGIR